MSKKTRHEIAPASALNDIENRTKTTEMITYELRLVFPIGGPSIFNEDTNLEVLVSGLRVYMWRRPISLSVMRGL